MLDQLNELSKKRYVSAMNSARIWAALGDKDEAFRSLETAYEQHTIGLAAVDPVFDPLRSDPRFAELLRKMNLQP